MMITPLYLLKYAGIRCAMATGKEQGAVTPASSGDQNNSGLRGKLNKVVLAYSGGFSTFTCVIIFLSSLDFTGRDYSIGTPD